MAERFTNANEARPVVVVENPGPALMAVPAKAFSSFADAVAEATQLLEPCCPLRNIVAVPKFATYKFGVFGAATTAVPPVAVV